MMPLTLLIYEINPGMWSQNNTIFICCYLEKIRNNFLIGHQILLSLSFHFTLNNFIASACKVSEVNVVRGRVIGSLE